MNDRPLSVCIVYDRLYPASIGGAERWYRLLAEELAAEGHRVTYVTARHWPESVAQEIPGVRVVTANRAGTLYDANRRRIAPTVRFATAAWLHLFRHGGKYDAVHVSAMDGLTGLGAVAISHLRGYRVILDWWEVWPRSYWQEYAGFTTGAVGWLVQWLLARAPHMPIAHSQLHAERLSHLAPNQRAPSVQRGLLPALSVDRPAPATPQVVYLGRHIPEKQVEAIVPAVAVARQRLPELQATLFGEGPSSSALRAAILAAGLDRAIDMPGFVSEAEAMQALDQALCLVLLSRREGYGLVVTEAAARGVPSVVLRHADSAASELIADGVNGVLCDDVDPETVASAILRINDAGYELRLSTLAWSRANARALTIDGTLPDLESIYRGDLPRP